MKITEAIHQTLEEFLPVDPYHINCGLCEDFAQAVLDKIGVKDGDSEETYIIGSNNIEPEPPAGHVWIVHKGKHYDSESPQGVEKFLLLKILKEKKHASEG